MGNFQCERCYKDFKQKSHYEAHKKRKTPCDNNADKIQQLVEKAVDGKLKNVVRNTITIQNGSSVQTTGLKRATIDKYYTSPQAVNKCIKLIKQHIGINKQDTCIEPSAGNGAFIEGIQSLCNNHAFYDLQPEHPEIMEQDYLEFDENAIVKANNGKIHVIGNPPFGRQSSLAIKFIKKSAEYCDSISFILPKSFKKDSLQKHFPEKFHLIHEYDLPNGSFIIDNKSYDVPCVFQIWIKCDKNRSMPKKLTPKNYKFVKKEDEHDISFRRVGVYAGKVDRNTSDKSSQSHYFIKFEKLLTDAIFDKIARIKYNHKDSTVGPRSISKQELIKEFVKIL